MKRISVESQAGWGWRNRLLSDLHMTSPSGRVFQPLWRGNSRTKDKKLGVFEIPQVPGAVVQDLDVSADRYPLTFYFDGPDHDLMADLFWQTCNERGTWDISHPVYGVLTLQLVGVTQEIQPVDSGNVTVFESEWLEPGVNLPFTAITQWAEDVRAQAVVVTEQANTQYVKTAPSILAQVRKNVDKVRSIMLGVQKQIAQYRNRYINLVNESVSDTAMFASTMQNAITLPAMMITDTRARFEYHRAILQNLPALDPVAATREGIDALAIHDLVASSALVGMATALVDAEITTREQAIWYIEAMANAHLTMTYSLDAGQALYDGAWISQSESYNDTVRLVALTTGMLLRRSFDLAVARRFTLSVPRTPIDIALTEGVDFDAFLAYNHLKGNDILLLPAGRTVVVYQ